MPTKPGTKRINPSTQEAKKLHTVAKVMEATTRRWRRADFKMDPLELQWMAGRVQRLLDELVSQ